MTNQVYSPNNGKPEWVSEVLDKFSTGVSHSFVLHGNVADYVVPGVPLKSYLTQLLSSRDVVAFYNRSEGITFPVPSMKKDFTEITGLDGEDNNEDMSDILNALGRGSGSGDDGIQLPTSPSAALPLLEKLLKNAPEGKAAVVVEYAEVIAPSGDVSMMSPEDRTNLITLVRWGRDQEIARNGNPVFVISENLIDLHGSIRAASSKFEAVEIPIPNLEVRQSFIEWYLNDPNNVLGLDMRISALANMTAGLSLIHIEDIFLRAEQSGMVTKSLVKDRKDSIIASEYGEVIEITDPRFGFEMIGGLDHIKTFFQKSVIRPMTDANFNRVPMGVLMTGPAGTGKSAVAEALGYEAGVNYVVLNLANILGQYVGNSERNLEKALRAIKALAPTIVFIDEIDQTVSRTSGGDSGVSSRIFKRLLEVMSDTGNRGKVLFLAATNRPDLMDAALRRPGRFDKKIPFLVPDENEREAIFRVMCEKYQVCSDPEIPSGAVANTEGWTGAEIEAATVKAGELIYDEDLTVSEALIQATERLSPSTADIEFMTALAIRETNDSDLLPPSYKDRLKDRKQIEDQVEEYQEKESRRKGRREL